MKDGKVYHYRCYGCDDGGRILNWQFKMVGMSDIFERLVSEEDAEWFNDAFGANLEPGVWTLSGADEEDIDTLFSGDGLIDEFEYDAT